MRPSTKRLLLSSVAPYGDALLAIDFVGSRSGGVPYYMYNGVKYASVTQIPGWTYTGGTPAGIGSYAAKADGSLQFFPSYTNLLLYSEQFDNAAWTKTASVTVTANATTAPNGTLTSDLWTRSATAANYLIQVVTKSAVSATYTYSIRAKPSVGNYVAIRIQGSYPARVDVVFNLSNGTISSSATASSGFSSPSATITADAQGFYLLTLTGVSDAATSISSVYSFNSNNVQVDGVDSVLNSAGYVWGAQLELGTSATTYIPTTTAAVTVAAPRITDAGYLAEEARTNLLTYSSAFDNAVWVKSSSTVLANGATAPDGTLTADTITFTSVSQVYQSVTLTATTYQLSVYAKVASGTKTFRLKYYNGTADAYSSDFTATTDWQRFAFSITGVAVLGNVAVANNISATSGDLVIWNAQLEAGSFATSPIPTTSVAVTRSADVGYISGLAVPTTGTLVAGITSNRALGGASNEYAASISDGTLNNRVSMFRPLGDNSMQERIVSGGVSASPGAIAGLWTTGSLTAATTYTSGLGQAAIAGSTSTTSAPASIGSMNRLSIANSEATGSSFLNAPIRRIIIYPRAMSNSELQAITTAGAY